VKSFQDLFEGVAAMRWTLKRVQGDALVLQLDALVLQLDALVLLGNELMGQGDLQILTT
jgi:hypothetical protein